MMLGGGGSESVDGQRRGAILVPDLVPQMLFSYKNWLSSWKFFGGGGTIYCYAISIVMLLFSDQISGRGKSFQGGETASGGAPCPPSVEESQKTMPKNLQDFTLAISAWKTGEKR